MSLLNLNCLAFGRRKHRLNLLNGVFERAQATKGAAQMGYNNNLCFGDGAIGDYGIGGKLNLHDAIPMSQGGYSIEINQRRNGAALNGNFGGCCTAPGAGLSIMTAPVATGNGMTRKPALSR